MLSAVLRTIREHALIAADDRVLVGISGGPDSTALLHALATLAPRLRFGLRAACVDHGLRPESAAEAADVVLRCRAAGIACEVLSVDGAATRKKHGSLQAAAREARLGALEEAARRWACQRIALGHTADDQAETVLFRIVRGTGLSGLAGIPYQRDRIIRPLLDVRRAQILTYVHKRKLLTISDPSNGNRRFARARIRHEVIPFLARENPRIVEALLGLAREARADVPRDWRAQVPSEVHLPGQAVQVIERLLRAPRGTQAVSVPRGEVVVAYGRVAFVPRGSTVKERGETDLRIDGPGAYRLLPPPAVGIELVALRAPEGPGSLSFDRGKLDWPLRLRAPRPGDRMVPRGGRGSRKLSDLLIDAKVPRRERALLPVLCDARGAILFVPGLRPAECGRPTDETRDWLEVRVLR